MSEDPAPNYDEDHSNFPYPSAVITRWDTSVADRGGELTRDDKKTLVDCAGALKNAIAISESGYIIYYSKIEHNQDPKQTPEQRAAAQKEVDGLYAQAKEKVATCSAANAMAAGDLNPVPAPPGGVGQNNPITPPAPPPPYNPGLGNLLPAMYGEADNINGEKFSLSTVAGRRVGQAYQGPVVGAYGTTDFSKASYTFTSNTQVTITAIWDKSGKPITLNGPVIINMNPK